MNGFSLISLFLISSLAAAFPKIPRESTQPGELCDRNDRHFKEYRYAEKVPYCRRSVSRGLKNSLYKEYGIPLRCKKLYTIDHLIPLSLGGNNSRRNLWPEHKAIKALRKNLEYRLYLDLKNGRISQKEALETILEKKFHPPIEDLEPGDPCATTLNTRLLF